MIKEKIKFIPFFKDYHILPLFRKIFFELRITFGGYAPF